MLDPQTAREQADAGIARVERSAERTNPGWIETAVGCIHFLCAQRDSFMTEDVREFAEKVGLPPPPDKRAWGAAVRRASNMGLIEMVGYAKQRSANCHGSPKSIWRAAKHRELSWPSP